jgi:hypothetical protein
MTEQGDYMKSLDELVDDLRSEYKFNERIARKIVSKADIDYHWSCIEEVRQNAYELAEFVEGILDCLK